MSSPSVSAPAGVREITIAQAVNEALAEELRRDETVFVIGEDVAEAGTPFKVLSGLVEEFGPERILDSPISEAGITGLGVGAAMTGMRPGGRHHVRRLPDARHGPAREPGREGALHVGRQAERAARPAHDARRDAPLGRPAQPEPAGVGGPHPGPQGRAAVDAVRREGTAQVRDPRRQPGRLHRGQDGLAGDGRGAGRGVHRCRSASPT